MTFSLLARDPATGALGGVAATGSLCVGGWVLRGRAGAGMSASQGMAPSTFWGEDVLTLMQAGESAENAVKRVTGRDAGRAQRQLSALDPDGVGAVYSGAANTPAIGERSFDGGVAAGNMLTSATVIDAMVDGYLAAEGRFADRLLAALVAAHESGSDSRGLMSAALLVVSPSHAPLTLRVDYDEEPIARLADLLHRATTGHYADWAAQVPSLDDPERTYAG